MATKLLVKRGTTAGWSGTSGVLSKGELGVEYDSLGFPRLKVGIENGDTKWGSIPYLSPYIRVYQDTFIQAGYKKFIEFSQGDESWKINLFDTPTTDDNVGCLTFSQYNNNRYRLYIHPLIDAAHNKKYGGECEISFGKFTSNLLNLKVCDSVDYNNNEVTGFNKIIGTTVFTEAVRCANTSTNSSYLANFPGLTLGSMSDNGVSMYMTLNGGGQYILSWNTSSALGTSLYPRSSTIGLTIIPNLGNSTYMWNAVYAKTGAIQTSDRSAKDSIEYLSDTSSSAQAGTVTNGLNSTNAANVSDVVVRPQVTTSITTDDVIDFISTINPATFVYKDPTNENEIATIDNAKPANIQLGLIADDIKNHKLFKYVGVEEQTTKIIEEAEYDSETGELIKEEVTENGTTLGLQAIPLTTAALTACKYLLNKVVELETKVNNLSGKTSVIK